MYGKRRSNDRRLLFGNAAFRLSLCREYIATASVSRQFQEGLVPRVGREADRGYVRIARTVEHVHPRVIRRAGSCTALQPGLERA